MEGKARLGTGVSALTFPQFWSWLNEHSDCIHRAGAAQCILYDDDEFHWHLAEDANENIQIVQLIWGKRLVGEFGIDGDAVMLVRESEPPDAEEDETLFELMGGPAEEPVPLYHFLMSHGFDGEKAHSELKQ